MKLSRRDIGVILPFLLAAQKASSEVLPSKCFALAELQVKTNPESHIESRQVFRGELHSGFEVACHITKLPPGVVSHPPHQHLNEEVLFMHEGTIETVINGKANRLGPGAVAFIHSNDVHNTRNVGATPAEYFILELHGDKAKG